MRIDLIAERAQLGLSLGLLGLDRIRFTLPQLPRIQERHQHDALGEENVHARRPGHQAMQKQGLIGRRKCRDHPPVEDREGDGGDSGGQHYEGGRQPD